MGKHKIPRPPQKKNGTAPAESSSSGPSLSPRPGDVHPDLRAATRHHAKLVNLDTGTHVDSKGVEHTSHRGNKPVIGPLTIIMAQKLGHPAMRFGDHAKRKTNVHTHMLGRANPHPNALAKGIADHMAAIEGSPAEEAAETPMEEAAEPDAVPVRRIPRPPRKAA